MRSTPYTFTATPPPPPPAEKPAAVAEKSYGDSIVRDLSTLTKRPPATQPAAPATETTEEKKQPTPDTKEGAPGAKPADITEGVAKFKTEIQEEIKTTIADPKRASRRVLQFINMARFFLYPWLYKRIIFEGPELTGIDALLEKVAEAEKKDTKPELNTFEKKLKKKWDDYDRLKQGVLWNNEEIDQINEVAYLKLAEIKFLEWLMGNEWALVIVYIESKRFVPVFGTRFGFGAPDMGAL